MNEWILIFIRDLSLAVWLGGLIVIDFVEAPAKFRTPEINRNQAVAVGGRVFAALNRMEVIIGALLLAVIGVLTARTTLSSQAERAAALCVAAMWAVALAQYFSLKPRMSALSVSLDLVNRRPGDTRYRTVRRLHRAYVALDLFKMLLGLVTLAMWTRLPAF